MATQTVKINRAPVLTMWATIVAERLGHSHAEALSLAKAVTGLNAQSKGRRLGIYESPQEKDEGTTNKKDVKDVKGDTESKAPPKKPTSHQIVELLGRQIPVTDTKDGPRALLKDEAVEPSSVERYLHGKFGDHYTDVKDAMTELAKAFPPAELRKNAYDLYEAFRPNIPEGVKGWGAAGTLSLSKIRGLAKE